MTSRLTIFISANPQGRGQLLELLRADAEAAPQEPGNAGFRVSQDILDPDRFVLCEAWESREALEEHFEHEHYKAVKAAFDDPRLIVASDVWATPGEDA